MMARIARHQERRDEIIAFARAGLSLVGEARAVQQQLEKLLAKAGAPAPTE
jgi:hypothetical protein